MIGNCDEGRIGSQIAGGTLPGHRTDAYTGTMNRRWVFCLALIVAVGFACDDDLAIPPDTGIGPPPPDDVFDAFQSFDAFQPFDAAPPVRLPYNWVVIADKTTGLGIGDFGADVDAMAWSCPSALGGGSGYGREVVAMLRGEAEGAAPEPALGMPDAPCDPNPLAVCAAPLGPGGWLALRAEVDSLQGCEIKIYEGADAPQDRFEVYVCTEAKLEPTVCVGPMGAGGDGAVSTIVFTP